MSKSLDNKQEAVSKRILISDLFSVDLLQEHIKNGVIKAQNHPTLPLRIYNYTQKAQYEGIWDECTKVCRGLIVDEQGVVVARPFNKFHNLNTENIPETKLENLPLNRPYEVTEKLDGSLGILWQAYGQYGIATRGSFTSEQALWATAWFAKHVEDGNLPLCPKDCTLLFEIIYPENRIVVDYQGYYGLTVLGVVINSTGEELPHGMVEAVAGANNLPCVTLYNKTLDACVKENTPNAEGYVVTWHNPYRPPVKVKVKFEDYCRLHRIVTGLNPKDVWEMLMEGKSFDELLTPDMPQHFRTWLTDWRTKLQKEHDAIKEESLYIYGVAGDVVNRQLRAEPMSPDSVRKRYALFFQAQAPKLTSVLFAMLDGKDYHKVIWKMVKPKATDPLRKDGE